MAWISLAGKGPEGGFVMNGFYFFFFFRFSFLLKIQRLHSGTLQPRAVSERGEISGVVRGSKCDLSNELGRTKLCLVTITSIDPTDSKTEPSFG